MPSKYTPGKGFVDTYQQDLDACEVTDCGPLDDKVEAACTALQRAKEALWDGADALATAQSGPVYTSLVARSDAAAKQQRTDEGALTAIREMNRATLDQIAKDADQSIAKDAVKAVGALRKAIELAEAKQGAPDALLKSSTLADHVDRVEKTRAMEAIGPSKAKAFYLATLEEGNDPEAVKLENAAENWLLGIVRGGAAKLVADNPAKYKINPGDATNEVGAAYEFLALITAARSRRVPTWLANARGVYSKLENLAAKLVGMHVDFLSPAESASLWTGSSAMPNPLDVSPSWPTRYLTKSIPLPGWSRIEMVMANGQVRRAPAGAR